MHDFTFCSNIRRTDVVVVLVIPCLCSEKDVKVVKVLKVVKDRVRYKIPLVGVLPQASFRLTAVGWG